MAIEVKVPLLPESISDATVSTWHKKAGDKVTRDENIVDLETDKVMLEVPAPADGVIKEIIKDTGSTVHASEVIAIIEAVGDSAQTSEKKTEVKDKTSEQKSEPAQATKQAEPQAQNQTKSQTQTQAPNQTQNQTQTKASTTTSARSTVCFAI